MVAPLDAKIDLKVHEILKSVLGIVVYLLWQVMLTLSTNLKDDAHFKKVMQLEGPQTPTTSKCTSAPEWNRCR